MHHFTIFLMTNNVINDNRTTTNNAAIELLVKPKTTNPSAAITADVRAYGN